MRILSKTKLKLFASLQLKKYRYQHRLFLVEGKKMVQEAYHSGWKIEAIIQPDTEPEARVSDLLQAEPDNLFVAKKQDFRSLSSHTNAEGILAVVHLPEQACLRTPTLRPEQVKGPGFLLDRIQDPGNLGTIIRTADWFGFPMIICSIGTVDVLNPKTLRSSMGSIFRVNIVYVEAFADLVNTCKQRVWLSDTNGTPLHAVRLKKDDLIVLGNEAGGLSDSLIDLSGIHFVRIPGTGGAESLNVSTAAGILGWELSKAR